MNFYILQESDDKVLWFDLYTNDLCFVKKTCLIFKRKYPHKFYRVIKVYR